MSIYSNDQFKALAKNYYEMFNNRFMSENTYNMWEDIADSVSLSLIKSMVMLAESTIGLNLFYEKIQNEFSNDYISLQNENKIKCWAESIYILLDNDYGKESIQSIKAKTIIA